MTTLNVILDDMVGGVPRGPARYTEELARALVDFAPTGCFVGGFVAASTEHDYELIAARLPGISHLFKSALVRRDLARAWQHGFTPVPSGMLHAPSLFAPLRRHDRVNDRATQIVVTIHDSMAWTHPDYLPAREVAWTRAMAMRAAKYADAVVVPTHAVATDLDEILGFGDRIRVIGSAGSASIVAPTDALERAGRFQLPERYLLTLGDSGHRHGVEYLLTALVRKSELTIPLVVVGAECEPGALASRVNASGIDPAMVIALGDLDDPDYSTVLSRASVFVHPGLGHGFGSALLEAFGLGIPVVYAGTSAFVEVAGDAGIPVDIANVTEYPDKLGAAIADAVLDDDLREVQSVLGEDRAALFSWRATAEGVWQLHADL